MWYLIVGVIGVSAGWLITRIIYKEKIKTLVTEITFYKENKLSLQFENLANKIFEEKQNTFKQQSQESMNAILSPLKDKLNEFNKRIEDSSKERFALEKEIKRIVEVNEKMTSQTENLTKALKGNVKAQGNWGEVILEKILEDSGLRKDDDYITQGVSMGLTHTEDGSRLKPDVIVKLPEGKHIIIDSKVSLTHYERFCSEEDQTKRALHLKDYLGSIRTHVTGLEQRRYQDTDKLGTPDFVLMFVPIEGAYSLAVQEDRELHSFAWNKKVIIVCPATLFATLRTIASIWRLELQNQNAIEIATRGGALYDKIAGFVDDMTKLGKQIDTTKSTFDDALNKFSTGKGNILRQTEQLKELGVKAGKSLPKDMLSNSYDDSKEII